MTNSRLIPFEPYIAPSDVFDETSSLIRCGPVYPGPRALSILGHRAEAQKGDWGIVLLERTRVFQPGDVAVVGFPGFALTAIVEPNGWLRFEHFACAESPHCYPPDLIEEAVPGKMKILGRIIRIAPTLRATRPLEN